MKDTSKLSFLSWGTWNMVPNLMFWILMFTMFHVPQLLNVQWFMFHLFWNDPACMLHGAGTEKQSFIQKTFLQIGSSSLFLYCKY